MFVAHTVEIAGGFRGENVLALRFHALTPLLGPRRPRPKWRTRLVSHQGLRWYRTSLLGRMPAWCPPVAPVGPWRPILIRDWSAAHRARRRSRGGRWHRRRWKCWKPGSNVGIVRRLSRRCFPLPPRPFNPLVERSALAITGRAADLRAAWRRSIPSCRCRATCRDRIGGGRTRTAISPCINVRATIAFGDRRDRGDPGNNVTIDLGDVGFRTIAVDRGVDGQGFGLVVNGTPVFCRGVCWTPLDVVSAFRRARPTIEPHSSSCATPA